MAEDNVGDPVPAPMMNRITSEVADALGHYVYALRDPRDGGQVFYVGKGFGGRIFSHVAAADASPTAEASKLGRIQDIRANGREVEHLLLRTGLPTPDYAFVVEQSVIDAYKAAGVPLSNLQGGRDSTEYGLTTVENAVARLSAPAAPACTEPIVMFIINRAWSSDMGAEEVYRITRGHWVIGDRARSRARDVFGVAFGIVRGVYEVESWFPSPQIDEERRWGFYGTESVNMRHYVGTNVRHLAAERGAQNPVRVYLDGIGSSN